MTIKKLISESNFKYFFNAIYKYYLKDHTHDFVRGFDAAFYTLFKNILHAQTIDNFESNFKIYISSPKDSEIDISILDEKLDELQELKRFKLAEVLNLEIISSVKLNDHETLAHILWNYRHELI